MPKHKRKPPREPAPAPRAPDGYAEWEASLTPQERRVFAELGEWCRSRRGQTIVCENDGATWLPFRYFRSLKSMSNDVSREAIWTNDEAAA